jgi:hypothetical protein
MAGAVGGAGRERDDAAAAAASASASAAAAAAAKAQAAREVCAASAAFASCPHRRRRSPRGSRPHFVDWYLVLAVSGSARARAPPAGN